MAINWDKIREDFPVAKNYVSLNNAAGNVVPKQVFDEVMKYWNDTLYSADCFWEEWLKKVENVRKDAAKFINAKPEEIAFTHSTSEGMNNIAHMIANEGSIITNNLEFPSSTLPWINRKANVVFVEDKNGKILIEDIRKSLNQDAKTIVTSHVQYKNGFRQDLEALGKLTKEKELNFVVNTTQSLGAMCFDVKRFNVDFMACSGLKWTLSSYGIGLLFCRSGLLPKYNPPFVGWLGVNHVERFENKMLELASTAKKFEMGSMHYPNIFGLGAAVNYLQNIGIKSIEERIFYLTDYLVDKLQSFNLSISTPLEKQYRSGIIVFRTNKADEIVKKLAEKRILVSPRGEGIRVSPHFYNNEADIDALIKNLKPIV